MKMAQLVRESSTSTPHVVIHPSPGMGHLTPLAELAKRLVLLHKFTVTIILPCSGPPTKAQLSVLHALPPSVNHLFLPPVSFSDLPPDTQMETIISLTVSRSLPHLRETIKSMTTRNPETNLVALVVDLFGTDAFDVAKEFDIPPYIFFCSTAMCLSLFLYLPKLDETTSCEFRELEEPVRIPGCVPIPGSELLDPLQDRKDEAYRWTLHHAKRYKLAEAIMVNTLLELEPGTLKVLQEKEAGRPPVYAVGPLVKLDTTKAVSDEGKCLKWLDEQPRGSVLYVSFGSGGTLSCKQINELALGLEMSEQRFIWVVRSPSDEAANATYFSAQSKDDPLASLAFLPRGFLDRTRGRALMVSNWAPQAQILGHESTGGFLTHCGWNSVLESVTNGVPLIVWPLYAEQKMNAFMFIHGDVKVALRPRSDEDGFVEREEVAVVVKSLMEGEEGKRLRNRMKDLKDATKRSLSDEGASTKALSNVVTKWKTLACNKN